MRVTFPCPTCQRMAAATVSEPNEWTCSGCGHHIHLAEAKKMLPACVLCGNHEIYKKKDFPHWLGMTILIVAVVLSTVTYYNYEKWWSWSFLIGSAIIDGVMYLLVGDVLVCYRCDAHYRGFTTSDAHQPFEIGVGERFRQERIRREQLKAERTQATVSGNRSNPT